MSNQNSVITKQKMGCSHIICASCHGQIEVIYMLLSDGAQIEYTAETPELIATIHFWLGAQLSDHGAHTTDNHYCRTKIRSVFRITNPLVYRS